MSVQEDMAKWMQEHGEAKLSPEQTQQVEKKSKGCYTCQQKGLRAIVSIAAFKVFKQKLEEDNMGKKIVVVVDDSCPPCEEVLDTLKPAVDEGEIEIINVNTCEEKDLAAIKSCGVEAYPSMTIRREDGSFAKPMNLSLKKTEVPAPEEKVIHVKPKVIRELEAESEQSIEVEETEEAYSEEE